MQAIRLHPAPSSSNPYSPSNPAPPSALHLDSNIPIPEPSKPGDLLIRIKATSIIRDALTWPETYHSEYTIPGNDFAGTVEKIFAGDKGSKFKVGDEVFGMTHADRPRTWAEYAIVGEDEIALKPGNLTWEEAAAIPLSALTAFEALYVHAGVSVPDGVDYDGAKHERSSEPSSRKPRILITGASGGVGIYLVQLARFSDLEVIAASSSNSRNETFLKDLGADQTAEYVSFKELPGDFDIIIDTVGGDILSSCWSLVGSTGTLITVDSMSFNFVDEHKKLGLSAGKEGVKAQFFIVSGGHKALHVLAELVERKQVKPFVVDTFPLAEAGLAYGKASTKSGGYGKVILTV